MLHRIHIVFIAFFCFLNPCYGKVQEEKIKSEVLLPPGTKAWLSIPDVQGLAKAIEQTSFGRMLEDEKVAPFVEDLSNQVRGWLDEKNIQFGLQIDDFEGVPSGELCIAGILLEPTAQGSRGTSTDHATLLLVDITDTKPNALALLEKVEANLSKSDAERTELEIGGVKISKWSFDKPRGIPGKVHAFHGIVENWLFTCDNERVVRDLIRRVQSETMDSANLANLEPFVKIYERCGFGQHERQVRWFIEPFGYLDLAHAVALDKSPSAAQRNDIPRMIRDEGFDAIKAVGGSVRVFDGKHDAVSRTFVYAPPVPEAGDDRYLRAAAMLDFSGDGTDSVLAPPAWVPADSASYITFNLNLSKAIERVGYIVDSFGREGTWKKVLDQLRDDPDSVSIDVRLLVKQLGNRITIIAATERPIDESSERMVIGFNVIGDVNIVRLHASNLMLNLSPREYNSETIKHGDHELWVMETRNEEELDDDPLAALIDPLDDEVEDEDELPKPKPLFERRVATVVGNFLLVANDVDYLKRIIDRVGDEPGRELLGASDYVRVAEALNELSMEFDGDSVVRHFGRLDASLETNYEMIRQGKMPASKTIMAQILNQSITPELEGEQRVQQLDGSKMPENYQTDVAPYLGPNGMIVKGVSDGWIILGCVLPKNQASSISSDETEKEDDDDDK
ncbi:MAG TPA: hypothetical protein PKD64_05610 [Pirellulaceae bacterium]|nr:hypothetical protein [Pirellulaceae bacterium]HMO91655.1 hypothetical protein [Pirellulaceae bacterium]HMP68352.1 hypothetical protein [Pirellulaceae bacterium]